MSWDTDDGGFAHALNKPEHPPRLPGSGRAGAVLGLFPRGAPQPVEVVPASDLLGRPEPEWLVDRVLPQAGIGQFFGESGSYKSFVVIDLLGHVVNGLPWFGRKVSAGPVVYVAYEGGWDLSARLRAWTVEHPGATLDGFHVVEEQSVNLLSRDDVDRLVAAIATLGPVLVVIDTQALAMPGGNENSAQAGVPQLMVGVEG